MGKQFNKVNKLRPLADRTLDAQMVTIDLPSYIEQIKKEKTWKKTDRNAITVFKTTGLSIVLMAMRKDAEISKHSTEGLVHIQVLEGKILINAKGQPIQLSAGQILALHEGIPHSLQVKKKTIFLLTLSATMDGNKSTLNGNTAMEQVTLNEKPIVEVTY